MIVTDIKHLLYIEPSKQTSKTPLIDQLTKKMTAALQQASVAQTWRGWHECNCGAKSDNADYNLPNGMLTNSLSVHYLAFHREEVPEGEIKKVGDLNFGEVEPTTKELQPPSTIEVLQLRKNNLRSSITG